MATQGTWVVTSVRIVWPPTSTWNRPPNTVGAAGIGSSPSASPSMIASRPPSGVAVTELAITNTSLLPKIGVNVGQVPAAGGADSFASPVGVSLIATLNGSSGRSAEADGAISTAKALTERTGVGCCFA